MSMNGQIGNSEILTSEFQTGASSRPAGRTFPFFAFTGTYRALGEQHGEALRDSIRLHLDHILERGSILAGLSRESACDLAAGFIPYVQTCAPHFWEEIAGLAAGAGIGEREAMLLQ